jgi:hypothetical protein
MKKVFSNSSDVIHLYAQRTQSEARCSNVFFEGNSVYSYGRHYELARFLDDQNILINNRAYSVTTSKHTSDVTYATRQFTQWFTMHTEPDLVSSQLKQLKRKLAKARKPALYISEAVNLISKFNEWLQFSGKININTELKELIEFFNLDGSQLADKIKDYGSELRKIEADKKDRQRELFDSFKNSFMNYEPYHEYKYGSKSEFDLVRVSECGSMLETSQNVRVPLLDAINLYNALKAGVNIVGQRIEHYQIRNVSGDCVQIGCHNIKISELETVLGGGITP